MFNIEILLIITMLNVIFKSLYYKNVSMTNRVNSHKEKIASFNKFIINKVNDNNFNLHKTIIYYL